MPQESLATAIPLLLLMVGCLGWLTLVALLSKATKLPEQHKWWANLLSLVAGPFGWFYHYAGHRGWIRRPEEGEHNVMAGLETAEPAPQPGLLTAVRALFRGSGRRAGGLPTETETVRLMLTAAHDVRATDIHLEPHGAEYLVRFRVNGILREHSRFAHEHGERVVSALKVMAAMDIADKHRMQDGRFDWTSADGATRVDLRLSTSPSLNGEKLAIRFLNRQISQLALEELGMPEELLATLRRGLRHVEGLVLIAGPTGSGKTSTAYSILQNVAGPTVNTMTIEDPVEYSLPFATQIGVNPKAGITFESGLRTLLRQDPNVIFVGEMRDPESFRIGIRASLSGHLVITTMHARDTVGVMTTLRTLGVDKETLGTALKLVISQRLVRVLCPECSLPDEDVDQESMDFLEGADPATLRRPNPAGCPHCQRSGFVARVAVFEFLRPETVVQEWLASDASESALRDALKAQNHMFLRDHARERVLAGHVWINDAIRAVGFDDA